MKGAIVNIRNEGRIIKMDVRLENGEKTELVDKDFRPYFYVPDPEGMYISLFGEKLKKIYTDKPSDVRSERNKYKKHYEADIVYVRRYMIDKNLRWGIDTDTLKPVDDVKVNPRLWYIDIEVNSDNGFPVPEKAENEVDMITIYDSYNQMYYSIVVTGKEDMVKKDGWFILQVKKEEDLFTLLSGLYDKFNPDIITGWNVIDFDIKYLRNRSKKKGYTDINFVHSDIFDMYEAYKYFFSAPSNKLKDVAVHEGIVDKDDVKKYDKVDKSKLDEYLLYNKKDVELVLKIDEKLGLVNFTLDLKKYAGVPSLQDTLKYSVLVDTMFLRYAKDKGYVLPSVSENNAKTYEGAIVLDPKPGLYENVAQFDMSRYYPNIVISFNLSPETYGKKTDKVGMVPSLCIRLLDERAKLEKDMRRFTPGTEEYITRKKKVKVVKFLTNAIYGYLAYYKSRLFNVNIASDITRYAREGILAAKKIAEDMGYKVIYGDTDSVFIQVEFDKAFELHKKLNEGIKEYFVKKYNLKDISINLKFEKYNKRIFFTEAKKRYAALVVWDTGQECEYVSVTGFEVVRSDQSEYTKDVQRKVLEMILYGKSKDDIKEYVHRIFDEFKEQPLEKIAIRKTISKPFDEYKVKPPHIRGSILANMYLGENIMHGDNVYMLYIKHMDKVPKTDVICWKDIDISKYNVKVDYDRMLEVTLKSKLENILKAYGIDLGGVVVSEKGMKKLRL